MSFEDYLLTIEEEATSLGVSPEIHPDDYIFQFIFQNTTFPSKKDAINYYFRDGEESAKKLAEILYSICELDKTNKINLLEFASGYGCVTRHFKNTLPQAEITACDIHQKAVDFLEEKLGISAVISTSKPNKLSIKNKYDAVFALSFFSHMPKEMFSLWLNKLFSFTKPDGFLIFTAHGHKSVKYMPEVKLDETGFGFLQQSEQKDLDTSEYGAAITLPNYVLDQIFSMPDAELIMFREGYWWRHQDIYVVKKIYRPTVLQKIKMATPKKLLFFR